jgi:hypothetical protein
MVGMEYFSDCASIVTERCFDKSFVGEFDEGATSKRRRPGHITAGLLATLICAFAVSIPSAADASIGGGVSVISDYGSIGGTGPGVLPAIRRTLGPPIRLLNYKHPLALPSVKRRRSIHVATRRTNKASSSERIRQTLGGVYYGLGEDVLPHNVVKNARATKKRGSEKRNKANDDPQSLPPTGLPESVPTPFGEQGDVLSPESLETDPEVKLCDLESCLPNVDDMDANQAETNVLFRETIKELRRTADTIRLEMELLRKEIREFYQDLDDNNQSHGALKRRHESRDESDDESQTFSSATPAKNNSERRRMFDHMAMSVEEWAESLVRENGSKEHGWKPIECNSFLKRKYNPKGTTQCFLKWMGDSRGDGFAEEKDGGEYPCVKCFGKLDAPIEKVCAFLANEQGMGEYNELVENYRDLEDVSPHSKICWGQCPQILFVKPRDFVTFCSHRWRRDGTQVIVNQAVDHEDAPKPVTCEKNCDGKDGKACRARALRGANIISKDPSDPDNKTIFTLIAHADPGGGLPKWACKTAVNAVAPIEPFKLYYNLNQAVQNFSYTPPPANDDAEDDHGDTRTDFVSAHSSYPHGQEEEEGRSRKPGGCSQLGYACFWPNGGGLEEEKR